MREVVDIPVNCVTPRAETALRSQGIPADVPASGKVLDLAKEAVERFQKLVRPAGILMEITRDDFRRVYEGEGRNAPETPLGAIQGRADRLVLFAVTVGEDICREITRLFDKSEFPLGSLLDTVASEGTELAAAFLETRYRNYLPASPLMATTGLMRFSPGYCGWHLSGQKKLFAALRPEEIGIELGRSFLMKPLKSISGVIVAGAKEIFAFENNYHFCADCDDPSCRERARLMMIG